MSKTSQHPTPLLVAAKGGAKLTAVSERTFWSLNAARKIPAPIKLGGKTLWRIAELQAWIDAGCPARDEWEARNGGQ
jgi:predicted DNA-binding transcriptional regulator AlpA